MKKFKEILINYIIYSKHYYYTNDKLCPILYVRKDFFKDYLDDEILIQDGHVSNNIEGFGFWNMFDNGF